MSFEINCFLSTYDFVSLILQLLQMQVAILFLVGNIFQILENLNMLQLLTNGVIFSCKKIIVIYNSNRKIVKKMEKLLIERTNSFLLT
jgi:hypothetical protein